MALADKPIDTWSANEVSLTIQHPDMAPSLHPASAIQTTATAASEPPPPEIPQPILTLSRSLVRPYIPTDAPSLSAAGNSPLIACFMRNTFPSPYTLSDASTWITIASSSSSPPKHFAILSPDGLTFYGGIGLTPRSDVESRTWEIGYWLAEYAWGRGIGTEVVRAFSRWAFETFAGLGRLEAVVFEGNGGSEKVLERAGYVLEGVRRKAVEKGGRVLDLKVYGLLREECFGEKGV